MSNPILLTKDRQQTHSLQVKRMAIYKQSKIIEATDELEHTYYFFFHDDRFLDYASSKKILKRSHTHSAFQKGLVLSYPHPLIETLIAPYSHFEKQNFNMLFRRLQKQYTLQQSALIATYFESFIHRDEIAEMIKSLLYKERRDGKLLSCYRILQILRDFAPNHSLLNAFASDIKFIQYDERYQKGDMKLISKDPVYIENKLFSAKHNEKAFKKLAALYKKQSRNADVTALYISRVIHTQSPEDYQNLHTFISEHFAEDIQLEILEDLYRKNVHIDLLVQDLLLSYLTNEKFTEAFKLMDNHAMTLPPSQSKALISALKNNGMDTESIPPKELGQVLLTLFNSDDDQAGEMLNQTVSSLLRERGLNFTNEWIEPFHKITAAQGTVNKISEMNEIAEDPNQQQRLGELYHEFNYPQKAIECMSWEMELRDDDPMPVRWLAKLYQELGMDEENKAYEQLYINMVKHS
ncbi:hypothetical protein LF817_09865 [Halobacillus sp. A1]|uniref:hypothetical protein n=1 Tax=Halobacillus sp. A1 TaxID=2880262 RepID=UPI0020A62A16|nr:hypothetical protein [Halobacillus sp. A1]MCP3031657.1 hypothetical protein [Halobacillus sp. A1]